MTQPKFAAAHQQSIGYIATNHFNGHFNNYPKPPSSPHPTEQFKFILRSSSTSPSRNTFPLGIVVGRFMPSLPYHIDRISGIFHSNIISSFGTQLSFDDHATSLTDFLSQVRVLFNLLDNILSLLNSSKQDIISLSFFIVNAEKYTSSFLKELHQYIPTDQISVSLVGVNFLLPPHSKVQAKTKILTRSAILSNFEVQKI
jgi:enamine deaminase RidA (YjgF/YER057c/UK114 family)